MTRSLPTSVALAAGLILLGVSSACKKPEAVQQPPSPPLQKSQSQKEIDAKAAADRLAAETARRQQEELEARQRAEQAKALELSQQQALRRSAAEALKDIHFDYDKSEIKAEDKGQLQKISEFMKAYPTANVEIQGHCDERGTNEYNLALGNLRASTTMRFLVALGTPERRFTLLSYGKEKPLCTEGNEACWSRNRRAHFELK